ncbi:hypothetical protein H6G33_37235 [Calothrix sp. FACHB-1219]|uniref:hypothetical protein n=1 Tax=unclassified Calothrix TaxID=2619626 RepID=UPI001681EA0B|nr:MULTISPECIES: hypothetical protein [unclassified Calothrix]MBD2208002.1 hypothetical protein [Calothrix sp. FACHB-168]MBD2222573.1 hypothetical protein [Calothrix sp. FACHB-1219]
MENPVTGVTECNQDSVTGSNPDGLKVSSSQNSECNRVTEKNESKEKTESLQLSINIEELTSTSDENSEAENSGYSGYTVTESPEVQVLQGFGAVTAKSELTVTEKVTVTNNLPPIGWWVMVDDQPALFTLLWLGSNTFFIVQSVDPISTQYSIP